MAYGLPGTSLNSARLVRVLANLAVADVVEAKQSLAERLGQWLDFTDAMALFSALNGNAPVSQTKAPDSSVQGEFARVRTTLADSITMDGVLNPGRARIKLPTPAPNAPVESAADFSPYHRYYQAHQRDMNAAIGPLRANVRAVLASGSPALQRLAALDAVLEQALATRERNLLATLPLLLAKRFGHLYKAHQEVLGDRLDLDDPEMWMRPGGWLAMYCRDMQAVLLAELEVRLQPVAGLIEALLTRTNEV